MDGDLLGDAKLQNFKMKLPNQFIENGIAEQDMVSAAGALALSGKIPFVNSFASFLSARANEQIYNNATEKSKIIYINLYSGLIPAGPGKSHQSLRDIALIGSIPGITIVQPANTEETIALVDWMLDNAKTSCSIRLNIGPSPQKITFDRYWSLEFGKGNTIRDGSNGILFSYGPVMLNEAIVAHDFLKKDNYSLKIVNIPWLNNVNEKWLFNEIEEFESIFVLEDHGTFGGLGDLLASKIMKEKTIHNNKTILKFGVETMPACGTPSEVLNFHGLNGEKLASRILSS